MYRGKWQEKINSLAGLYEKFHILIKQHLGGRDLINLSQASVRLNQEVFNCDSCVHEIYAKIDFEDPIKDNDDAIVTAREFIRQLRYVLGSKRKYKNYRIMCYDAKSTTAYQFRLMEIYGDIASRIELIDANVDDDCVEDIRSNFPNLRSIQLTSFRGDYLKNFLPPFGRFVSIHFVDFASTVDLKAVANYGIACKQICFMNSAFENLDSFTYFGGYCDEFRWESNRKIDLSHICQLLEHTKSYSELVMAKKATVGVCLVVQRDKNKKPNLLFSRRKDETKEQAMFTRRNEQQMEVDETPDNKFMRHRANARVISTDSSDSTISTTGSELLNESKDAFKVTLEVHDLTWPLIETLAKSMPTLEHLTVFKISTKSMRELFRAFKRLRVIIICSEGIQEEEFSRAMFPTESIAFDPIMRLSGEALKLCIQHLEFDDFIKASQVSKRWNEVLSTSENLMEKVIVKMDHFDSKKNFHQIVNESSRNYQSFELNCKLNVERSLNALKTVHTFSSTLIELDLWEVNLDRISAFKDRLNFSQLKHLKLHKVDEKASFLLFQNCTTLETLKLSSMSFHEYLFVRVERIETLVKLALHDCNFDYFETFKDLQKPTINSKQKQSKSKQQQSTNDQQQSTSIISLEDHPLVMKLIEFDLIFDRVNGWKVQETVGFKNFLLLLPVGNVEIFKVSGVRGEHLKLISRMPNIQKVQIGHIWEKDLIENDFKTVESSFELQSTTFAIGQSIKWRTHFPTISTLQIGSNEFKEISETNKMFKKMLKPSAEKMITMRTFKAEKRTEKVFDPMVQITESLHPLMFQHFNAQDVLNSFEVSNTWNNILKESLPCSRKYVLYIRLNSTEFDRTCLEHSSRKYLNLITDFYKPTMIKNFENLRKLSVSFAVQDDFVDAYLPHLETLIIQKCPGKLYNPDKVLSCFKVFAKCQMLKYLEIYEAVTSENAEPIIEMLANNKHLKTLTLHGCTEFYHLFATDITPRIKFQLENLYYTVHQKYAIVGTNFESNVVKFLAHQKSLKKIEFKHMTAAMLNTIFAEIKGVEYVKMVKLNGFETLKLTRNESIKHFLLMNFSSREPKFQKWFDCAPNLEYIYYFILTNDFIEQAARKLKKLKQITCERYDGPDGNKFYRIIKRDRSLDINRNIILSRPNY